jgi:hypothetical protein
MENLMELGVNQCRGDRGNTDHQDGISRAQAFPSLVEEPDAFAQSSYREDCQPE